MLYRLSKQEPTPPELKDDDIELIHHSERKKD
jgi:hypothetical protein